MTEQRPTPPGPQVQAATLTTATTGAVIWTMELYLFHGAIPGPIYGLIQLGLPALLGYLGAEMAYLRARRRLDVPKP